MFEKDTDAYARVRDEEVMRLARDAGVQVVVKVGRTLYDPDEAVRENGGKPTMSISQLEKVRTGYVRIVLVATALTRFFASRLARKLGLSRDQLLHPGPFRTRVTRL